MTFFFLKLDLFWISAYSFSIFILSQKCDWVLDLKNPDLSFVTDLAQGGMSVQIFQSGFAS